MRKQRKSWVAGLSAAILTAGLAAGCGAGTEKAAPDNQGAQPDHTPYKITIATAQVDDVPAQGNEVQTAIESYTNTKLDIQWIPNAAYDDKVNVMIAANEMPMMLRVKYTPTTVSAIQSGLFWEVGPLLKDYKNLSAQNPQYFSNISVDGKVYGVPLFRDLARPATIYRKDWLDTLGLKPPVTLDDWYSVMKAMALNDPDKNGKNDTYGMVLSKKYNEGSAASTTRLAVAMGAPNKWGVDKSGKFTPEFMSKEWMDVTKMLRQAYADKLINQDFAVLDESEQQKIYDSGRGGIRIAVAGNAKSMHERLIKTVPKGEFDVMAMIGPQGIRASAEAGNNGFFLFPKAAVKTEKDLKQILTFIDKMMDEPMTTLQLRGIEGKHYVKADGSKTEFKDFNLFQREVKPYRDSLFNLEGHNVAVLKDTALGERGTKVPQDSLKNAIANPALTLISATYSERGSELEQLIYDAQTKYIMGKIDDAGWQAEVERWKKSGGDKMIKEYEEAYAKSVKK